MPDVCFITGAGYYNLVGCQVAGNVGRIFLALCVEGIQ